MLTKMFLKLNFSNAKFDTIFSPELCLRVKTMFLGKITKNIGRKVCFYSALLLWLSVAVGCATTPIEAIEAIGLAKAEQEEVELVVSALTGVNPDRGGRASPVVLTIYQLTNDESFRKFDGYRLTTDDLNLLNADIIQREQITILPGKKLERELLVNTGARYLAFFAAFQNMDTSTPKLILFVEDDIPGDVCIELTGSLIKQVEDC